MLLIIATDRRVKDNLRGDAVEEFLNRRAAKPEYR